MPVILGYQLTNEEKFDRVINGSIGDKGKLYGGVGENASDAVKIAEYDRLGGQILNKDGHKVKNGSFWDIEHKKPKEKPEVILQFKVNGVEMELPEGDALPLEVKASQLLKSLKGKKKAKKSKKDED